MKIYTITCHDVYNFGASLQAYALMKYLSDLGHEVQIIDYKPEYLSKHYRFDVIGNPKYEKNIFLKYAYIAAKFPERYRAIKSMRKKRFDDFTHNFLSLTDRRYISNEDLKHNLPKADIYIAGSDQIWNCFFENGKDPAFYLDFVPDNRIKASYAASFSLSEIPEERKDWTKERIEYLDYVSVREKSGLAILNDLGIKRGVNVLDPVFLLNQDQWNELEKSSQIKLNNDRYLICYDFDKNPIVKDVCLKVAKEKELSIFSFFKCDYADKVYDNVGPIEFLTLIKHSQFVVSNSFHATAFSIIYEKEFLVIDRLENINSRMHDLLSSIGLDNQLKCGVDFVYRYCLINYEKVHSYTKKLILDSQEYLNQILSCSKKVNE